MNCHFLFLYGFLIGYIFRVSCTVHTVQSVSLLSLKRLCGLRNACTALVASSRQNTTYIYTYLLFFLQLEHCKKKKKKKKCNFLVGAETVPTVTSPQTTCSHAPPYMANIGNLRQFVASNPQGTVFSPNQCLYQKEATGVGNPKM